MTLEKEIDLSLLELIEEFKNPDSEHLKCFIVNQIGTACFNGEDDSKNGKEFLISLLEDEDLNNRLIAFSWISSIPEMAQSDSSLLKEFRVNPDNKTFLKRVDRQIKAFNRELK